MNFDVVADHTVSGAVDGDVAHDNYVLGERRADAAHARWPSPIEKGLLMESSADIEAAYAIRLFGARREHDDRQVALEFRPQPAGNFDFASWQHPVEQHDVRQALVDGQEGLFAIRGDRDLIAFLDQVVPDQLHQRGLVLDDQGVGLGGRSRAHGGAFDLSCC